MSTCSLIGQIRPDGQIVSVYCHFDGYPKHSGRILLENYTTLANVLGLISGGDISVLAPKYDKPRGHTFDHPVEGYTVYYGRDRGEFDVGEQVSKNEEKFFEHAKVRGCEYVYLFKEDKWLYGKVYGNNTELKPLTQKVLR